MTDNELLLAIADIMDKKLDAKIQPLENEINSLKEWLNNKQNYYICDKATINDDIKDILDYENVLYTNDIVGDTKQCFLRATEQIINNIKKSLTFLIKIKKAANNDVC